MPRWPWQHRIERGQLVGGEKAAGLLQDALVALGHLLQEIINVRLGPQKRLVRRAGDALRQIRRLGLDHLEQLGALLGAERIVSS